MASAGSGGDERPAPGGPCGEEIACLEEVLGPPEGAAAEGASEAAGEGGLESNQALIAAREHLASVAEELASIQRQFDENRGGVAPAGLGLGTAARAGDSADARALEAQLRHLEVDRDEANLRAERLFREKEELLAARAELEAELRATRRSLDEMRRLLRHRDLELQQLRGHAPLDIKPLEEPPAVAIDLSPKAHDAAGQELHLTRSDGWSVASAPPQLRSTGPGRPASSMSKPQALASLRSLQAELRDEQGRQTKIERRMRKERERTEGLIALAERQRGEIGLLRRRGDVFEAYAGECERKLKHTLAQVEVHSMGAVYAANAADFGREAGAGGADLGGYVEAGHPAAGPARQRSAPTRLPGVPRGRA